MRRGGQRSRVAPSVYRVVFAITFDLTRCLSLFLFFLFSTFPLSSRPFPFRRSSWLTTERCAFVAPTIALPISVITVCETRVRLLLFFLFVSVLSSPIVLACPLLPPPSSLLSRRFILRSRTVGLTQRKARLPSVKEIATLLL